MAEVSNTGLRAVLTAAVGSMVSGNVKRGPVSLLDALEGNLKGWGEMNLHDMGPAVNSDTHQWVIRAVRNDGVCYAAPISISGLEMQTLSRNDLVNVFRLKVEQAMRGLEELRRCNCRMDPDRGLVHCDSHPQLLTGVSE